MRRMTFHRNNIVNSFEDIWQTAAVKTSQVMHATKKKELKDCCITAWGVKFKEEATVLGVEMKL